MPIIALTTSVIDTTHVEALISLVKTCMGLFSEYPLNIMLIASLCGVAFGLFRGARASV